MKTQKIIFPFIWNSESTKLALFKNHVHLFLSEGVFDLCEVNLNLKQQTLVQWQTEKWKGKIKIKINKIACMWSMSLMHLNYLLYLWVKCCSCHDSMVVSVWKHFLTHLTTHWIRKTKKKNKNLAKFANGHFWPSYPDDHFGHLW